MDKDRIKGTAQKIKGSIEKVVGRLTGNTKLETAGRVDKAKGAINTEVGKAKDVVRDALREPRK